MQIGPQPTQINLHLRLWPLLLRYLLVFFLHFLLSLFLSTFAPHRVRDALRPRLWLPSCLLGFLLLQLFWSFVVSVHHWAWRGGDRGSVGGFLFEPPLQFTGWKEEKRLTMRIIIINKWIIRTCGESTTTPTQATAYTAVLKHGVVSPRRVGSSRRRMCTLWSFSGPSYSRVRDSLPAWSRWQCWRRWDRRVVVRNQTPSIKVLFRRHRSVEKPWTGFYTV